MKNKTILVVDDDREICKILQMRFEAEGFEVNTAVDEFGFREKAMKRKAPDLMILDIMIGEKRGPELYTELVKEGLSREIPVVFLTSLLEEGDQTYLTPGKNFALYRKPFEPRVFIQHIKDYFHHSVGK